MNCKPGDLAIVINAIGRPERIGLIVAVASHCPQGTALYGAWTSSGVQRALGVDAWVVVHESTGRKWLHSDSRLRPIRPGDLEDETPTVRELEAA